MQKVRRVKDDLEAADDYTFFCIPKRRCENNIKMGLRGIYLDGAEWFTLAQDRELWYILEARQ